MKTLVFFGSARQKGHTKEMMDLLTRQLEGEIEIIDCYHTSVAPCKDCRYCWHKRGCSIKDGMQAIYEKIESADNIVLASPMYFHTVTGPMKIVLDRLQVYWASHVRKDKPEVPFKKGAILMVGGAPDFEIQFNAGEQVLINVLKDLDATCEGIVTFANSDYEGLKDRPEVIEAIGSLASRLNQKLF